ncbi:type 2 lanthipeptide synthetase LanM family protein [Paenibacillus xylaniclasticus]|uniref:type 2 lanthipeptide synthetase LanM family protein n=1 Tax=Paenibacillus xylaniclasticus TaxID=588083 RepID=UPI000FDC8B76|nr:MULTISPECIES: type 2 lanthipeptide synthetase LanM family protein [Paenibacillus]GFN31657.1 type 2 lantibiotic biosynthesis protein [Paenibacillus curdlanolyticus]
MTTAYAFRALHINERKSSSSAAEEADLTMALPYWRELLGLQQQSDFDSLLEQRYQIDVTFVESHFDRNEAEDFGASSEWVDYIEKVFIGQEKARTVEGDDYESIALSEFPFYTFFEPFLREFYYNLFYDLIADYRHNILLDAKNDIVKYYLDQLYTIAHKTLMLEINYLRTEGHLSGSTPEERYLSYVEQYLKQKTYRLSLLHEYPVMFRLLAEKTRYVKRFILEAISRSFSDWAMLSEQFGIREQSIERLELGQGDSHKQGRAVAIIRYSCGGRIVYKPRNMKIDDTFQQLLAWMNDRMDDHAPLLTVSVSNREEYGWMQFVEYKRSVTSSQAEQFYYRLGKLLAVLHTMNATDFHYENIIACSNQPVLIDLESLFHHPLGVDHDLTESEAINKALMLIRDSVLSTGVIPIAVDKRQPFDISGIGGGDDQLSPFKVNTVEGAYTDEIRLTKQFGIVSAGHNNPIGTGDVSGNIAAYLDHICRGFAAVYTFFMQHMDETRQRLMTFAQCEIRKILSPTMKYAKLLYMSYHPDFMRNQLDRELLLNRVTSVATPISRAAMSEIEDMLGGDIPYFSTTPSSRDLWDSRQQRIDNFYTVDALQRSLSKLENYSETDLANQLTIIRATILAMYAEEDVKMAELKGWSAADSSKVDLVSKAELIADSLIRSAVKHVGPQGEEYCWTSMVTKGGSETMWQFSITGPGLYDGNPGIALFFAYLWQATGQEKYRQACEATIRPIELVLEQFIKPDNIAIGAFLGLGGMAYSFYQLGRILDDSDRRSTGVRLLRELPRLVKGDRMYDLIGGSAGALTVLARIMDYEQDAELSRIGDLLVGHLIAGAKQQPIGIAWCPGDEEKPYIGFSHGNAGIVHALCCFMPYSEQKDEIIRIIEAAVAYENTKFDANVGNWYSDHLNLHSLAWCHGAPGILLSRLEAARRCPQLEEVKADVNAAVKATLEAGIGDNYSFCHGAMGNGDILMQAASAGDVQLQAQAAAYEHKLLDKLFAPSGVIKADVNAVGVMNGLASIGYGLLRIHDRERVPSLLTLEIR